MPRVVHEGKTYEIPRDITLLDGLLAQGIDVPFGCRTGTCQSCLMTCPTGTPPAASQKGLRETQVLNGQFLACQCYPEGEMVVALPHLAETQRAATVERLRPLNDEIMEVSLRPEGKFLYRAGQFVRLYGPEGFSRSYSLASTPQVDACLVLHIREYPNGQLSSWVHHRLAVGDAVRISDPLGECFYIPGHPEQPLLLIGTGSGLAPLFGILGEALQHGHTGPIHLYHGARDVNGLYHHRELQALVSKHSQLDYQACISSTDNPLPSHILQGRASDIALGEHPDLKGWRVYLCGNPEMVRSTQMQAYLAGAALNEIHADPFDAQSPTASP